MALGVVALAGFLAVETGWAGFGWAQLKATVYPADTGLLGWVPESTGGVVIVDPHQLDVKALGAPGSPAREAIDRTRADVKEATGIDIAFDVDKLLLSPSLAVAHGRFDQKKLTERLTEHRYALAERKGEVYLVRAGEDAIGVVGGSVLLYGDEPAIKAAIDAHEAGTTLEKSDPTKERLSQVGWNHPLLVTVRITDEQPSLRAILTGATGPRAVTVGVSTARPGGGLDGTPSSRRLSGAPQPGWPGCSRRSARRRGRWRRSRRRDPPTPRRSRRARAAGWPSWPTWRGRRRSRPTRRRAR